LNTANQFVGCSEGGGGESDIISSLLSIIRALRGLLDDRVDEDPILTGNPTTYEGCLSQCKNYYTIYLQANPTSNNFFCVCEGQNADPTPTACGTTSSGNYYTMSVQAV
jgi:hypothetical protein